MIEGDVAALQVIAAAKSIPPATVAATVAVAGSVTGAAPPAKKRSQAVPVS